MFESVDDDDVNILCNSQFSSHLLTVLHPCSTLCKTIKWSEIIHYYNMKVLWDVTLFESRDVHL